MRNQICRIKQPIRIVGCGGVGAWAAFALSRMASSITLMDGDRLEKKNIDRQLFSEADIGKMKSDALAERLIAMGGAEVKSVPSFLDSGSLIEEDILLVGVDNNPARINALEWADMNRKAVVISANEVHSSEAYYYDHLMRGTAMDPRIKYPELLTDHSGDPLSPCSSVANNNIQLAVSNFMAASNAVWLLWFWCTHARDMDISTSEYWPKHVSTTPTHIRVAR